MASAIDVANFFLSKVDREAGDLITQMKLYKLVYYAQAWSLVFLDRPLFESETQAWIHGPVTLEVREAYIGYGRNPIPAPFNFICEDKFSTEEIKVLEEVWATYGELSASALRKLTHEEYPWAGARFGYRDEELSQELILLEEMKDYYSSFVEETFKIPEIVKQVNKKRQYSVSLKNGSILKVNEDSLEQFLASNIGNLLTAKSSV